MVNDGDDKARRLKKLQTSKCIYRSLFFPQGLSRNGPTPPPEVKLPSQPEKTEKKSPAGVIADEHQSSRLGKKQDALPEEKKPPPAKKPEKPSPEKEVVT